MKKNTLEKLVKPINRDQKFKDIEGRLYALENPKKENKFMSSRELSDKSAKDIAESFGVTAQEAMDNIKCKIICPHCTKDINIEEKLYTDKQWIDLCIDNLPERFFTRDDIEIEYYNVDHETWGTVTLEPLERTICIDNPLKVKYHYRLVQKKKDSIHITQDLNDILKTLPGNMLGSYTQNFNGNFEKLCGRKVEIID